MTPGILKECAAPAKMRVALWRSLRLTAGPLMPTIRWPIHDQRWPAGRAYYALAQRVLHCSLKHLTNVVHILVPVPVIRRNT